MTVQRDAHLRQLDGLQNGLMFCIWAGLNPMSAQRMQALLSIQFNAGSPVMCLTAANIAEWQHPDQPFHPAFEFLSATHKADYLRVYLMHHYGGGYTDIKHTQRAWRPFFEQLQSAPDCDGLGYTEIGPNGVARLPPPMGDELRANYQRLVGLCAFVFRKQSRFTSAWFAATEALLDSKLDALRANPARHPQDQTNAPFTDGTRSPYPLAWTELLGNIFHPLVLQMHERIVHDSSIAPAFSNYR